MCNLYTTKKSVAEIASLFRVTDASEGSNTGELVYPGYPGLVIADGAVQSMIWGFPLVLKSKRTGEPLKPKPVNNARTDKLDSYIWRSSFADRRCLIPLSAWAEAEGAKGNKTRTWQSLPDAEAFAVDGIWRDSDEWGKCYSMVMTDAVGEAVKVHNRMPVILSASDFDLWQGGAPQAAKALCVGYDGPLTIDRTTDPWVRR